MNTRRKGMVNELKSQKQLEHEGWLTYRVKGSTKWNKQVDIFGLWDILGISKQEGITKYVFVQVKTNKKPSLKIYQEFVGKYKCAHTSFEVWVWKDRKGLDRWVI